MSARIPPSPWLSARITLSLVVWALLVIVSLKYFVFDADRGRPSRRACWSAGMAMGLFGAALIDLRRRDHYACDLGPERARGRERCDVAILTTQVRGTASIGRVFGPTMMVWFAAIACLGISDVVRQPQALAALNPAHAITFLVLHGTRSLIPLVLGGVFLAITGAEALYADMAISGATRSARLLGLVLPALLLSYAGQTALLIQNPTLEGNPFFLLAPGWAVVTSLHTYYRRPPPSCNMRRVARLQGGLRARPTETVPAF